MPRINRALRRRDPVGFGPYSSQWQILQWGTPLIEDGPCFKNENEEKQTWIAHRVELLAACAAGTRPTAYYKFDLGITDRIIHHPLDQIDVLRERGLLTEEEMQKIDLGNASLSPRQKPELYWTFDSAESLRRMHRNTDARSIKRLAREFEIAARWHTERGRPELAERYLNRAAVVNAALMEGI